jgi:exopolysaccharide biosynthesis protein
MNNELSLKVDVTELELYALKTDVNNALNNKVNKENGKSLVSDSEIAKIHEHNNKDVLDRITQDKINAWELAEENEDIVDEYIVLDNYDNIDNLWSWYNCYDDFNWVMYDEV